MDNLEKEEILFEFINKINNQVDIPPEFSEMVDLYFWDLISDKDE